VQQVGLNSKFTADTIYRGGAVEQRVQRWTCDQQVVSLNATRGKRCITT